MMLVDAADATASGSELHFVQAEQHQYQQRAFEAYARMKENIPAHAQRFKSFAVADPRDVPGLQAADLMVGHWARGWSAARVARPQTKGEVTMLKLLGRRRLALPFAGKAQMEELLSDMERELPGMRARLRQVKPDVGYVG